MSELHKPGIAILASGSGSTAEAFIHDTQHGRVDAEVELVICSKPPEEAGIYERIERLNAEYGLGIPPVLHISGITHPEGNVGRGQTLAESEAICWEIDKRQIKLVALMGYMKKLRGDLLEEYGALPHHTSMLEARMLNTHPGPLPATADTWGIHASERVIDLGLRNSAHTVHVVSEGIDEGDVWAVHTVPVLPDDTPASLFDRVQAKEKAELPPAIDRFLKEQAKYCGDS